MIYFCFYTWNPPICTMFDPPESGNPSLEGFTHKVSIGAARRAATAQQNGEEVVCVEAPWLLSSSFHRSERCCKDMPLEAQGMLELVLFYNWRFALTAWLCDSMVSEECKHVGIVAQLVIAHHCTNMFQATWQWSLRGPLQVSSPRVSNTFPAVEKYFQ